MESKTPFNIIIVTFLVFALIGLYWLSRLGLDAGVAYLWLFIIGVVFVAIAIIAKLFAKLDFWFEIPINRTSERGILLFVIGIVFYLIFIGATKIFSVAHNPFVFAPLAQFGVGIGSQSFSALTAATSPFWEFFIIVISASVIEETVLGFGFVLMGSLVMGYGLRRLLKLDWGEKGNEYWDFIMAMLFSIVMFSVLHFFNGSYVDALGNWNWSLFLWAAFFRFALNLMIYKFGNFGLLFSIGVHATNNALFLGGAVVSSAILSIPGGLIIIGIILVLFLFFVMSLVKIIKEGELLGKDFITFD